MDDVPGRVAGSLKRDSIDRSRKSKRTAEVLEEPHEAADERPGSPLGKEHAPLPLDPVDQRVYGARLQRIPADEQGVKAERLPEVLVFDKS